MAGPVKLEPLTADGVAGAPKSTDEAKDNSSAAAPSTVAPPPPSSSAGVNTFATPIGVIVPPPDVRVVVDRTADFVRRLGAEGEAQLILKNKGQRKFAFLLPSSPYHAYYKQRVQHGAAADSINDSTPSLHPSPPPLPSTADAEAERRLRAEAEQRQKDEEERLRREEADRKPKTLQQRLQSFISSCELNSSPPPSPSPPYPLSSPPFRYSPPSHYSSSDLDIVNLTALYAACIGPSFIHSLTQRERSNPQFDFLKTVHPLHSYFTHVQQCYTRIQQKDEPLLEWYRECSADDEVGLHRLIEMARWQRAKDAEEEKSRAAKEEVEESMAAIDWHSFVVVETIEFHPDEEPFLPAPKQTIEEMEATIAELAIEEEREKEERERREKEKAEEAKQEQDAMFLDASLPTSLPSVPAGEGIIEHVDEMLEIRSAPVAPPPAVQSLAAKLVTCVVCGDTIAAEDLEEHLRIELLDPQWKEQRQQLLDRQRESSLVGGKSLSENLRRFERKKREVGRERSREEEEKQAREDAVLLRGAAREQLPQPQDASTPPPPAPTAATGPVRPVQPPTPVVTVPVYPSTLAPPPASEEPDAKRLRPSSPQAASLPSLPSPAPSATSLLVLPPPPPISAVSLPTAPLPAPSAPAPVKPQAAFVPESLWLSANPLPLTLHLHIPTDPTSTFNLQGQMISIPVQLTDSVDALKVRLSGELNGLPGNRQQFQLIGGAFLKEGHSFAFYNLFDGANINLKLKERGGKKK